MSARACHLYLELMILAVLALSVVLLIDQLGATAAFCQDLEGCAVAREVSRRWFGPLPLPVVSLVGYAALLGLTLAPRSRWAIRWSSVLALLGGMLGFGLLLVQALKIKEFCPYCVGVDLLSIMIAAFAGQLTRLTKCAQPYLPYLGPVTVVGYAVMALLTPPLWVHFRDSDPVPASLEALQVKGKVTLIEFVDLQCPHCRALYPTLEQLERELPASLIVRRLHVPFKSHPIARQAARLLHCAPDPGLTKRLEQALFATEVQSEPELIDVAKRVGVSETAARACWEDPNSERALEEQRRLFKSLGRQGLPVTYVGGERINGVMPKAIYRAAIERSQRPRSQVLGQSAAFLVLLLLLVPAIYFVGQGRRLAGERQ